MTCLLKEMYRASNGEEPRYEAIAWGETHGDQPHPSEVSYTEREDCETSRNKAVDPRLADCPRCRWFYQQFVDASLRAALKRADEVRWAPLALPTKKEEP